MYEIASNILLSLIRYHRCQDPLKVLSRSVQNKILAQVWYKLFSLHAAYWWTDLVPYLQMYGILHNQPESHLLIQTIQDLRDMNLDQTEVSRLARSLLAETRDQINPINIIDKERSLSLQMEEETSLQNNEDKDKLFKTHSSLKRSEKEHEIEFKSISSFDKSGTKTNLSLEESNTRLAMEFKPISSLDTPNTKSNLNLERLNKHLTLTFKSKSNLQKANTIKENFNLDEYSRENNSYRNMKNRIGPNFDGHKNQEQFQLSLEEDFTKHIEQVQSISTLYEQIIYRHLFQRVLNNVTIGQVLDFL